jgi:hypothetical protein
MIYFSEDLTKYLNDQAFYNLEFLEYEKKLCIRYLDSWLKRNYKTEKKNNIKNAEIESANQQLKIIQTLIEAF